MKVINSLFLFANLSASVSDMLVKYFLITVKSKPSPVFLLMSPFCDCGGQNAGFGASLSDTPVC